MGGSLPRSRHSIPIACWPKSSGSPITPFEASSEKKAVAYLRRAGANATGRSALQDARLWFEHALDVLGALPTHLYHGDSEHAEGHYRRALALAEPRCMRPLMAHCHHGLGQLYCRAGKRQKAHEYLCTANTMYR